MEIALIRSYTDKPWRSPETYQLIEDSLAEKWRVESINTRSPETLFGFLAELRREHTEGVFVFNIAEYLDEKKREGFIPGLLDEWNTPHLGSGADVVVLGLDKGKTKELLIENRIPTPRYGVVDKREADIRNLAEGAGYPLMVKPIWEGGHIGISDDSIVYDHASLDRAVKRILDDHHQPALVEEYIGGNEMREFSVGIIDAETRLFTPVEIDYEAMDVRMPILSHEAAVKDLERIKLVQEAETRDVIIDLAERTFVAMGARDYSRVDMRMNQTGCYVLEINVMPGLGPHSFLPEAAQAIHALEYNRLIQKLAENSMKRFRRKPESVVG